ncbi:uncharacterized protein LOC111640043 [Centruroides sculpturatus]|uniref:uncharacterized protein LOC111640043 n=1 Tax=Centruroides sculpturatus TaxID=218467 RepID=UPI000C6E7D26|nr:uncharacterized protein LOC111640043 [Centruroides sculpturatus]
MKFVLIVTLFLVSFMFMTAEDEKGKQIIRNCCKEAKEKVGDEFENTIIECLKKTIDEEEEKEGDNREENKKTMETYIKKAKLEPVDCENGAEGLMKKNSKE